MVGIVTTCFEKMLPLSQDMLLTSWVWVNETCKGGAQNSELWKSIRTTIERVLVIPVNIHQFKWFNLYFNNTSVSFPLFYMSF